MPQHRRAVFAVCALLAILFFHLAVVWQDLATLARNGFLYDDSFYAFKIAKNIASGQGMTFDGIHPTTGFQPLYVFLLVPVFLISGDSLSLPIYIALSFLAVLTFLTAYLLYRICRRYVSQTVSLIAAVIWAFSPIVARQSANGLETALATFMIALCAFYYLEKVRSVENPPGKHFWILGLLLGLAVLSRIDALFLVLVILLDYLLLLRKSTNSSKNLARLFLVPLGVMMLYSPWLIFNVIESGSPLQDSGVASRFIALAYAPYFGYGTNELIMEGPDFGFIWTHITCSIAAMKVIPPAHVVFRSICKLGEMLGAPGAFQLAGNILGFLILVWVGSRVTRWKKQENKRGRGEINFLLLFSVLLVCSYAFYIFGVFFFLRYYYPIYLVACIYGAFLLQDFFDWLPHRSRRFYRLAIAGCTVYVGFFLYFSYSQAFRSYPVYPFYDIAQWVDENTKENETIGVFQCGTIGYLSHRRVINLDGKVNREALDALKCGDLESYLREEGIDVVLDHPKILEIFLGISWQEAQSCNKIVPDSMHQPYEWVAFRYASEEDIQSPVSGSAASSAPLLTTE